MKTFCRHYCQRRHRSHRTTAQRLWPRARWIKGDGSYALLAHCDVLTIALYASGADAIRAKAALDEHGCGSRCVADHDLIRMDVPIGRSPF